MESWKESTMWTTKCTSPLCTLPLSILQNFLNVLILKLNQVTVDDEEGSHDNLTFQQLQTMLLEQFGENFL